MATDGPDLFRLIAANVPDNIMLVEHDGTIAFINWTVPPLTVDEVIGTSVVEYVPEAFRESMTAAFARVVATKQPDRYVSEYVAPDGSVSRWESRVAPVIVNDAVDKLAVISSHVTELRAAESDRERFFELSLDFLVVLAPDGTLKRHNDALQSQLGYAEGALLGERLPALAHPDDRDATTAFLARLGGGERVDRFQNRIRGADGSYRTVQWRAAPMMETGLSYAAGRDVTEQQILEMQLLQSQKMDAVGQLAGGVAHDFNNLVLAILINADFALARATDGQTREELQEIKRAAQRAVTVTTQLLAFSRQQPMDMTSLDLSGLVADMAKMLRRTLPPDIDFVFTPTEGLAPVHGDAGQIEQVVLNLCLNARDAMPHGGRLAIETQGVVIDGDAQAAHPGVKPGTYVRLSVTDTGVGMTPEVRERICEPFFTTKPQGKGTGLGLAMAHGIAEQHGGTLHITSELGKGSAFELYLPVAEHQNGDVVPRGDARVAGGPLGGVAVVKECILVVEDTHLVRGIVVRVLEQAGYRVIEARDGAEGLAKLKAADQPVHAALLDIVMPGMSGPETGKELLEYQPSLRVLYTSGYSDGETQLHGLTREQLLDKPYEPGELLRRIRSLLD